jgi:hypothetical protein
MCICIFTYDHAIVKPKIPAKDSFSLPLTIVTGHMQPGGNAKQKVIASEGRPSKSYSSKLEAHDHTFSWITQQIQNLTFSGFLPPHTAHSTVAAHSCWMHQMPQKPPPAFISTIAVKPVGP